LRRYTLEEFRELPEPGDRSHYDLIGGYLFMVPSPAALHDDLDSRLTKLLVQFLINNQDQGQVYHPHAAIY
jgi:Uma2 family endonuclease